MNEEIETTRSIFELVGANKYWFQAAGCSLATLFIMQMFVKPITTWPHKNGIKIPFKKTRWFLCNETRSKLNIFLTLLIGLHIARKFYTGPDKESVDWAIALFNPIFWWLMMIWIESKAETGSIFYVKLLAKLKPWRVKRSGNGKVRSKFHAKDGAKTLQAVDEVTHFELGEVKEMPVPDKDGDFESTVMIKKRRPMVQEE